MGVAVNSISQPSRARRLPSTHLALRRVNLRDAYAVWRRNLLVYLRMWRMHFFPQFADPFVSILAFGWGIGSLVAAEVGGVSYFAFVGAGVLTFGVVASALFETTYGTYARMSESVFEAILVTPVEVESLAFGEICWSVTAATFRGMIVLLVLTLFGAVSSPAALLAPLPLATCSFFVSGISLGVTAKVRNIYSFNLYTSAFFSLVLLCGVWFPLEVMPATLQWVGWALPITSAINVTRALLTGRLSAGHIAEFLYLVVSAVVFTEWALRSMRRRMLE